MIEFTNVSNKSCIVKLDNQVLELQLKSNTVTNKLKDIVEVYKDLSTFFGDEFDKWFFSFLNIEEKPSSISNHLLSNIDKIIDYSKQYINSLDLDLSSFSDASKSKKNSIFFTEDELRILIESSLRLKFLVLLFNRKDIDVPNIVVRNIYSKLTKECSDTEISFKLYSLVKSKTYKYNMTDAYMWEYIKTIKCKTIDTFVVEIFNFIMSSILVLCMPNKNPITYFVAVIDESIRWFLRSIYKETVIYEDSIQVTDVQSTTSNSLRGFAYNDTITKIKSLSYEKIFEKLDERILTFEDKDNLIAAFQNRLSNIKYISPIVEYFVYPLLSAALNIPYVYFTLIPPTNATVISAYYVDIFRKVFGNKYDKIYELLEAYLLEQPSISTTYKIKDIYLFINNDTNFYGFKSVKFMYEMISHFIGKSCRVSCANIFTNEKVKSVSTQSIEKQLVDFYCNFFSGKLEKEIMQLRDEIRSNIRGSL